MTLPSRDAVLRFTIQELKELAEDLKINIASITKRDDMLKAVLISAYADSEPLSVSPARDMVSPPLTSSEDVSQFRLATPGLPLQTMGMPLHSMQAASLYPSCTSATYFQPSMPLMASHLMPSTSVPPGFRSLWADKSLPLIKPSYAGFHSYGPPVHSAISEFDKWRFIKEAEQRERDRERERERQADREFEREQREREQAMQIKLAEIQAAANANSFSLNAANASNAHDSDPSLNTRPFRVDLAAKIVALF
jgi:hypothetical protein